MDLVSNGVFEQLGVELIGARKKSSPRRKTRLVQAGDAKIGLDVPKSRIVHTIDEARDAIRESACR